MGGGPRFAATHAGGGMNIGGARFAGARFAHAGFSPRFSRVAFHNRFFHHRFAFIGAPFAYAAYDSCWRRVWTSYGPQWVNVCYDYSYGY
jgi:hypothetical protein